MARGRPWTTDDIQQFLALAQTNLTSRQTMATILNRSLPAIHNQFKALGLSASYKSSSGRKRSRSQPAQPNLTLSGPVTGTPYLSATRRQCQYPLWDNGHYKAEDLHICGRPGYPWCAVHRPIVLVRARPTSSTFVPWRRH